MQTTIYLDAALDARLRQLVPGRGLNRFIAEAVAAKVSALEKERIEQAMKEGYLATTVERTELESDWTVVDVEGWSRTWLPSK